MQPELKYFVKKLQKQLKQSQEDYEQSSLRLVQSGETYTAAAYAGHAEAFEIAQKQVELLLKEIQEGRYDSDDEPDEPGDLIIEEEDTGV